MSNFKTEPTLDQLLSNVPSEMLYEIFINLPFGELLNIFTLNREIYNLFINSEYFFARLCNIYCKLNDVERGEYVRSLEMIKKENNFQNLYRSLIIELINDGYRWDTEFKYFSNGDSCELTRKTMKTVVQPSFGDFYTVKSTKLLKPGKIYKWKMKLDSYNPEAIDNTFKIMIGIESLYFPFDDQKGNDCIGWQEYSKGIALIIGEGEIIQGYCNSVTNRSHKFSQSFRTGDIIQIEFDFQNIPNYTPYEGLIYEYAHLNDDYHFMGLVRFSLIRDGNLEELKSWIPFGDARFAPYVPAVSVNMGQTISFV